MKKDIHPQLYKDAVVTCACGSVFTTSSTKKTISVEICSACHPFYTGQQKFVDTEGRIDKFSKKLKLAEEKKQQNAEILKNSPKTSTKKTTTESKKSLKDMLEDAKTTSK